MAERNFESFTVGRTSPVGHLLPSMPYRSWRQLIPT
jgi:hypothetical protein